MTRSPEGALAGSGSPTGTGRPPMEPWDAHNRRLVEQVHPLDWVNPPARGRYHLVVVGAGLTTGLAP